MPALSPFVELSKNHEDLNRHFRSLRPVHRFKTFWNWCRRIVGNMFSLLPLFHLLVVYVGILWR
jgi:hypothetical protein